jgi:hypothetical protein
MRRVFNMYSDDTDSQMFKYLNIFACIKNCEKWADICQNPAKNKDEQYNPDAPAPAVSAGRPELGQKKLKELKKAGHPAERLQVSFHKCWADARAHAADGAMLRHPLGTPRGRYEEHNSKFPSVVKPRFIEPVGESQTSEGDAC